MLKKVILLICFAGPCLTYRLLGFFPLDSKSHHNVFAPILYELAKKGHHVVYLTPIKPKFSHENLDVRLAPSYMKELHHNINLTVLGSAPKGIASHLISRAIEDLSDIVFGNPEAQRIIHSSDSYDAVLLQSYFAQDPASALIHKFGCVGIEVSPMGDVSWLNEISGLPDNPSYQLDWRATTTDKMDFIERLLNFYGTWSVVLMSYYHMWRNQFVMDKYFQYAGWEERPFINKLISNRSIVLINYDSVIGYPTPKAPHVKSIGGLNINPNKPLPKDIQNFMDGAEFGVIYFSLGSNLQTSEITTGDFGEAMLSVFRKLKQRILMKWESNSVIDLPPNVKTSKWFPQNDILAHPNCVLFITHGGYLSMTETAYYGVPIVGIPFYGDQPKNVIQAQHSGFGVLLEFQNVTKKSAAWAIKEIITNRRYKEEALRRSMMMREKRHSGLDEAVYWIEYAIRYPNALTPRSAFMTFFEVHNLDIYLFIIVSIYLIYHLISELFLR